MSLGPLPYKAKVSQAQTDQGTGMQLVITVLDGSAAVRSTQFYDFSNRSFQSATDVAALVAAMHNAIAQQFLIDAPDLPTALDTITVTMGG